MFESLALHLDKQLVHNSSVQSLCVWSGDPLAITVASYVFCFTLSYLRNGNNCPFEHPKGFLYGFFGKSPGEIYHGILNAKTTGVLMDKKLPPPEDLFPSEKNSSGKFIRISILGRSLLNEIVCCL
jgi:hypothetical protein